MRNFFVGTMLAIFLAAGLGCADKNIPASPGTTPSPGPTPTATDTPTGITTSTPTPTDMVTSTPCVNQGLLGDAPVTSGYPTGFQKNWTACRPVTLSLPGTVYDVQIYVSGPCSFLQAGLYADNGSHYPGSLLTATLPTSVSSSQNQVFTLSMPATLLPAGTYWMAVYGNDPTGSFVYFKLSGSGGTSYFDNTGLPMPATFRGQGCCNSLTSLIQEGIDYCY